jgi:uncharacterized membrane protein YebE (DUF533 family)
MDHVWLAQRMGRAADVDLGRAYADGQLTQKDWADIVQTCRGCSWAPQCDRWLARHDHEPCAPTTCLNRARFEELRRAHIEA